jgi:toxin YoeB
MLIAFSDIAWNEYQFWQKNDKKILKKINVLLIDIKRNPRDKNGIGKPEYLKANLSRYISRRITSEHRLVYKISQDLIIIASCKHHY